ncbi:MAG TPA: hypothetical protein VFJ81_04075 [Gemmatimonadales bacterium]|nr:hypothetical protein [Gemmatimonadales bacterium]
MSRTKLAALALLAAAACGRGDKRDVASADSLNRDLQLAPVDTSAALNDRPSADTATATPTTPAPAPAPEPKPTAAKPKPTTKPKPTPAAAPAPSPSAPSASPVPTASSTPAPAPAPTAGRELASGATFSATTDAEIRSNKNKVGDQVTATVAADIKNSAGQVVIPAGSKVTLEVTAIKESENKGDTTGTLTLKPTSITINGNSQTLPASISGVKTSLQGRSTNAGDIAKVGAGTAAGAIVGRVLGGSTKGAVIGGIIGGAVGAQRAVETKDRDVVLPSGTQITLTLNDKLLAGS